MIALSENQDKAALPKSRHVHAKSVAKTPRTSRLNSLLGKLADIKDRHMIRRQKNLSINQLLQLDEKLLRDIGISRDDVLAVKHGGRAFDSLTKHQIITLREHAQWNGPAQLTSSYTRSQQDETVRGSRRQ